jgi:hypothetical protein
MWEQITKADIQRARTEFNLKRAEALRRHAEELNDLDAQLQDIEQFERIVAAFFEEYVSRDKAASETNRPYLDSEASIRMRSPRLSRSDITCQQISLRFDDLLGDGRGERPLR